MLRGSGATDAYVFGEVIDRLAWRGRWRRTGTLEYYLQEVAAQTFLTRLDPEARARILLFAAAATPLLAAIAAAGSWTLWAAAVGITPLQKPPRARSAGPKLSYTKPVGHRASRSVTRS